MFSLYVCVVQVQQPSEYDRESWALNDEERLKAVPVLHGQGNKLFKQGRFEDATMKYKEAIVCIKNVQSKVKYRPLYLVVITTKPEFTT